VAGLQGGCVVRKAADDVTYYYDYDQHPHYMYWRP